MDPLSRDQAALVFRRAAELEAAREAANPGAGMDLEVVEAAGREAGLSPAAVREAVAELRARGVRGTPAASVVLDDVVAARTVARPADWVAHALGSYLEDELLVLERHLGDRTVWVADRGLEAVVERRLHGAELHAVRRLVAGVVQVPGEARTHVRLEAEVAAPSAPVRAGLPLAAATAAGTGVGIVEPAAGIAVVGAGAVLAVLGWRSARAAHRRATGGVHQAFDRFLDWLDRG